MSRNAFNSFVTLGLLATFAGCSSTSNITSNQMFGRRYSPETRFKVARAQEQGGKLHEAREIYMKLYRDGHASAKVCHRLAIVSAKMNDKQSSDRFFREALTKDQRNADLLSDYGYAKAMSGDLKGAEAMYRQALQISPGHKRTLNNLGIALAHQKRDKESLNIFRRAVGEAQAYSNLAYVQAQRGDGSMAARSYSQALSIDPKLKVASNAMIQLASIEKKFLGTRRGRELIARAKQRRAGKPKQPTAVAKKTAKRPAIRIKPKSKNDSLIASIEDKPAKSNDTAPMPVIKPASKLGVTPKRKPIQIVEHIPALPERNTPRVVRQESPKSPVKPAVASDEDSNDKPSGNRLANATSTDEEPRKQPSPFPTTTSTIKPIPAAPQQMPPQPAVVRVQSRFKPPVVVATPTIQPAPAAQPTPIEPPKQETTSEKPEFVLDLNDEPAQTQPAIRRPQFVAPAVGVQPETGRNGVSHAGGLGRYTMPNNQPSPQQTTGRIRLSAKPRRAGVIKLRSGNNAGATGRYRLTPGN